jgi:N utilization substance protein B
MGNRRRARECALQILFQLDFPGGEPADRIRDFWAHQPSAPAARTYADWLVDRVRTHGEDIDGLLRGASEHWRMERMAVVDRNILRIAAAELLYEPSLVPAIVIDEAVEVAKKYSGEEAAMFVNGVLDAVRRKLADGAPRKEDSHERPPQAGRRPRGE